MGFLNNIFKKNDNVFIAYDENDEGVAKEVCEVLEYNDLSCWLKSRDLSGTAVMVKEIMNAIKNAGLCVVIYSKHSKDSNLLENEIDTAFDNKIPFVVFKIDDIKLEGALEFFLQNRFCIHAYSDYKDYFPKLIFSSLDLIGKNTSNIRVPPHLQAGTKNESYDAFISYSTKDRDAADKLCYKLEANGIKCWIAPRNIRSGVSFIDEINRGIKDSNLFIPVFSDYYQQSKFTKREFDIAVSENKSIVPFRIDYTIPEGEYDSYLRKYQWIDASANLESGLQSIVVKASDVLGGRKESAISKPQSETEDETPFTHDAFISYSSRNIDAANAICEKLESKGYKCWIHPRDIKTASNYVEEVMKGIKGSELFIPVFSSEYQNSNISRAELDIAYSNQKTILPFRLHSFPENEMEFYLRNCHWIDAEDMFYEGLETLVQCVSELLSGKIKTQITIESDRNVCGLNDSVVISGVLMDSDENPLGGMPIKINADGENVGTAESTKNGSYQVTLDFDEIGYKNIEAVFEGKGRYSSSDASIDIEVCKLDADITLSATSDSVTVGNVIALSGSLKSEDRPVARAGVDIYKGDDLIDTVITSNAGRFSMLFPTDAIETLKFKAVFKGNDIYSKSETSNVIVKVVEAIIHDLSSQQDIIKRPFEAYQGKDHPYIFVSYAHKDAQLVFPEIKRFHDEGYPIWYDQGLTPGHEWDDEVANALINCSLLVIFLSDNSMASINVQDEIKLALKRNIDIVPIYFEETELPPGLELRLSNKHAIMKFLWESDDYISECFKAFDKANIPKIDFND